MRIKVSCRVAMATALLLLPLLGLQAQGLTVRGTVTSLSDGEPLIGATVQVQGSQTGVVTDFDGNFTVNTDKGNYRIELYNTYGGSHGNSAFAGETADGNVPSLGFQNNIKVTFTIDKLF